MPEIFGKILVFKLFKSIHAESMRNFFRNIPILGLPLFAFSLKGEKREKKSSASFRGFPLLHFAQRKNSKKCPALFQGFPLLYFAQRKIQQKLSAFPFVKASPRGGHRPFHNAPAGCFVTDCCKLFKIINKCLFLSLPPGGKVDKAELWTNEGRSILCAAHFWFSEYF